MGCYMVATSDPLDPLLRMLVTDIALLATTTLHAWPKKQN